MDYPLISIIIVTYNRCAELVRAIESVYAQDYHNIELIVIDNNSKDNTRETINRKYPEVIYHWLQDNLGCPGGRNYGFEVSIGEFIFFLDDDAWLGSNNLLSSLFQRSMNEQSDVAIIIPNILEYTPDTEYLRYTDSTPCKLLTFIGGASFIKRNIFEKYGPFPDTEYGSEEKYIAIKLFYDDLKIILYPDLVVHHKPSIYRNKKRLYYLASRNDMIWTLSHATVIIVVPLVIAKLIFWIIRSISRRSSIHYIQGAIHGIVEYIKTEGKPTQKRYTIKFLKFLYERKRSIKSNYSYR